MKRRNCRGIAAIETALVMFATTSLLVALVNCGRLAQHGAAVDSAASNSARYLATVPLAVLHESSQRDTALRLARKIVDDTLAAAGVDVSELQVFYSCDPTPCASLTAASVPGKVGVQVVVQFHDALFPNYPAVQLSSYAEVGRDD